MNTTATTYPQRTASEIFNLKKNWEDDPCWDIETTEGFEAHREELLAFRLQQEKEWAAAHVQEVADRRAAQREQWGSEISDAALDYMHRLEERLSHVESVVELIKPDALYQE